MIFIARAADKLDYTIEAFDKLGEQVCATPLFFIEKTPLPKINFSAFDGVIFTSASAVHSIVDIADQLPQQAFCVGQKTAEEAQKQGFKVILTGFGNGCDLAADIIQNSAPCRLLHLAGAQASTNDFAALLTSGFFYQRQTVYTTEFVQAWPQEIKTALKTANHICVPLFSSLSVKLFFEIIQQDKKLYMPEKYAFFALSDAVAAQIPKDCLHIEVATEPTLKNLINLIQNHLERDTKKTAEK